jgi:hypothetical protein
MQAGRLRAYFAPERWDTLRRMRGDFDLRISAGCLFGQAARGVIPKGS